MPSHPAPGPTSRMTAQIWRTQRMMASGTPDTVTARSVELGSRSPATCTWAPVVCGQRTGPLPATPITQSRVPGLLAPQGIGSHKPSSLLETPSPHLSDLLDLGARLPNQRATLACRDDKAQGHWRPGDIPSVCRSSAEVLARKTRLAVRACAAPPPLGHLPARGQRRGAHPHHTWPSIPPVATLWVRVPFLLGDHPGPPSSQPQTSSSLKAIMETAWKTAAVDPVMVVMRSGQEPSEMVIRALLCGYRTSAGQRGSSASWPGTCLPATHQAPAKAGSGHLLGALSGGPRRWIQGQGGAGISLPLQTRYPGLLSQTASSPVPGFALQSLLSAGHETENGS